MLIKCHCCGTVIEDRSKSIYNEEHDVFFCNTACNQLSLKALESKKAIIKCQENYGNIGQLYLDF